MIDGQSEQSKIRKAMKIHEIVSSDKESFAECKSDLMKKVAMDESEAEDVASSIRELFLPKLMKAEGLNDEDMPEDFIGKMTDNDDDFETETLKIEDHDEDDEGEFDFSDEDEDHETDADADEDEVDANEIATIHITVPADKIREVEKALETVLGDTDAMSEDQAIDHKEEKIGDENMNKEIEARKALRKTILAAMADDEEVQHVSRKDGFEHAPGQQYFEEEEHSTVKGNLTDPDFATLDYADNKIPSFLKLEKDKGLKEIDYTNFDGTPEDSQEFTLAFDALAELEIPSQGDADLYHELEIPSEGKLSLKRTVQSSTLGEFDANAAEEVLAFALKTAGVEDEDLGKLTYAEALDLFKAIKTAEKHESRVMEETPNNPKEAVTEKELRGNTGTKEIDPEKDHERSGKELYSSADDQYASMLRKLMKGASEQDKEAGVKIPSDMIDVVGSGKEEADDHKKEMEKEAELYKARLKTAYAMSTKLATAGLLPTDELDTYAEGMISDGLTVTAMIRQTKLMLNSAAANSERLASSNAATRTATAGISFNPSVRGAASADLSGASEIQNALKNIGWTAPQVTGMED
jgi:hypothetical protein